MSYDIIQMIEITDKEQGVMLHAVCDGEIGEVQIYKYDNNGDIILHLRIKIDGEEVEADVFKTNEEGMIVQL